MSGAALLFLAMFAGQGAWRAGDKINARDTETQLLARIGNGFRIWKTEHFVIAYDTPVDAVRPLVGRLEGVFDSVLRFRDGHDLNADAPVPQLSVIFFASCDQFTEHLAEAGVGALSVAGAYLQEPNHSAFCHTLDSPPLRPLVRHIETQQHRLNGIDSRDPREAHLRRDAVLSQLNGLRAQRDALVRRFDRVVIQHEAAHQVLFNAGIHVRGGDNPDWLVEGLACQFETAQPAPGGLISRVNQLRLADFRAAVQAGPNERGLLEESLQAALAAGRLIPIRVLLSDDSAIRGSGNQIAYRYAQAWALVHYLHRQKRIQFADYVREVAGRGIGQAASPEEEIAVFERHFGPADIGLDRTVADFIMNLRFDPGEAG